MEDSVQKSLFEVPNKKKFTLKKREPVEDAGSPSFVSQNYAVCLVNIRGLGVKTFSYAIPPEM